MTRSRQASTTTRRWPCIFRDPLVREQVDPRIKQLWEAEYATPAPFGDLRNQFRRHHCRTLNPYGSEACPYSTRDCAAAFYRSVTATLEAHPRVPVGYFIKVAKTSAAIRADEKPLSRDRIMANREEEQATTQTPTRSGKPGAAPARAGSRPWVRGPEDRPFAIGEVLRSLDPRSRAGSADDGQEGTER